MLMDALLQVCVSPSLGADKSTGCRGGPQFFDFATAAAVSKDSSTAGAAIDAAAAAVVRAQP